MNGLSAIFTRLFTIKGAGLATQADKAAARGVLDTASRVRAQLLAARTRNFSRYPTMATPPTVTRGVNATSTVDASFNTGNTRYKPDSTNSRLYLAFFNDTATTETGGIVTYTGAHITDSTGTKGRNTNPYRIRFISDAPAIDFCFLERAGSNVSFIIDGEIVSRKPQAAICNTGNYRYFKVDFGADVVTYGKAANTSIAITAGGTGYAVGDLYTADGGTNGATGSPTVFRVAQTGTGGSIVNVVVETTGAYAIQPTGTFSQASTTGSGTGAQIQALFFCAQHTTRKLRKWEVVVNGPASFMGIVTATRDYVAPWAVSASSLKVAQIGDSITAGTYPDIAAGHPGLDLAQMFGLMDNVMISGIGGTGWNAGSTPWSHPNRVADFIRYDADIYFFLGSQNDAAGAATTAAVTATLNAILAANRRAYIIGLSNIVGGSLTVDSSIAAGYAAVSDPSRVRFISTQTPIKLLDPTYQDSWVVANDNSHPSPEGIAFYTSAVAPLVFDTLLSMAA